MIRPRYQHQHRNPDSPNNGATSSSSHSVRTVGDGTTAIAAFGEALNKPDFADVIFKVSYNKDEQNNNNQNAQNVANKKKSEVAEPSSSSVTTIYAHRAILAARSPVFKQMFFGGFPESKQKEVAVVDEFKPEHFMTVLEWAYTGRADMSARDVLGVLRAANFYGFDDLVAESRDLAQSFIDEENVLHLLEHASQLGETTLVFQCLNFIKCHAHSVLTSPVWLSVSPECVERVLQLPAIDCEEALLFEQALSWLETNTTMRADLDEADKKKKMEEKLNNNNNPSNAGNTNEDQDEEDEDEEKEDDENEKEDDDTKKEGEKDDADEKEKEKKKASKAAAKKALLEAAQDAPYQSAPLVRRFFRHLRLSHLSVHHLLDRVRPLLIAHPSIRSDYVRALEFLVDPGHLNEVSQVPRAPTVLATVQVDVPAEFLRGWNLVTSIPQSTASANAFGFNSTQVLPNNFFTAVPPHASYVCVGEMVVGRDDIISIIAVGTVRMVRPIINSRSPVVCEEGDICWHASPSSFGFTPKQTSSSSSSSKNNNELMMGHTSGMPGRSYAAPAPHRANQNAGVRFVVSSAANNNNNNSAYSTQNTNNNSSTSPLAPQVVEEQSGVRHGKRFIYFK